MTNTETGSDRGFSLARKGAAWAVVGFAVLIALQGVFLLFLGFDEANFAESAGIDWETFAAANPDAAAQLEKGGSDRVFAVTAMGLGLQAAVLAYLAIKRTDRVPGLLLWVLPAVVVGWGLVLLPAGDTSIGAPSLAIGLLLAGLTLYAKPVLSGGPTTS